MEKITEKYYLGSNKNTFILYEKRTSEAGKESFKNIGYLATLESVYTTLIDKEIKKDITILNNINKINNMIKELREFTIKYVNEHDEKINKI